MLEFLQLEILPGLPGINQTLDVMVDLTNNALLDPIVRSTALRLLPGSSDPVQLATRIRNYIARRLTRIMERPEQLHPPDWLLYQMQRGPVAGDCDDAAMLAAALLASLGFDVHFVVFQNLANPDDMHVFTEVFTANGWIPVDPAVPIGATPPPGWVQIMERNV